MALNDVIFLDCIKTIYHFLLGVSTWLAEGPPFFLHSLGNRTQTVFLFSHSCLKKFETN